MNLEHSDWPGVMTEKEMMKRWLDIGQSDLPKS